MKILILVLMTLAVSRNTGQVFCMIPFYWNVYDLLLFTVIIILGFVGLREEENSDFAVTS